jgi:hypothetical protein
VLASAAPSWARVGQARVKIGQPLDEQLAAPAHQHVGLDDLGRGRAERDPGGRFGVQRDRQAVLSITVTRCPARASSSAVNRPAAPPPMTAMRRLVATPSQSI